MKCSGMSYAFQKARIAAEASFDNACLPIQHPAPVAVEKTRCLPSPSSARAYHFVRAARIWVFVFIPLAICTLLRAQKSLNGTESDPLFAFQRQSAPELMDHYFDLPTIPLFITRRLIHLDDPRAIPGLRNAFDREAKPLNREFIAAALVRLGDTDSRYFSYLIQAALDALNEDIPYRSTPASDAETDDLERHVEIQTWAQTHSAPVTHAIWQATIEIPGAIEALGLTEDRRSMPIFLRALKSPNVLVVRQAAFALARMRQKSAVGPIVAACQLQSIEDRPWTAKSLLYFRSEKAQKAARKLINNPAQRQQWRIDIQRAEAARSGLARLSKSLEWLDRASAQLGSLNLAIRNGDPIRTRDALREYLRAIQNCRRLLAEIIPGDVQDGLASAALDRSEGEQRELKPINERIPPRDSGILEKATRQVDAVESALREEANAKRP